MNDNDKMNSDIFRHASRHERTKYSADKITDILIRIAQPLSVVDVGCGVGTFLNFFNNKGVKRITGLDSTRYLDLSFLQIPRVNFIDCELHNPPQLNERYDLCISLEVAEHLSKEVSETFIYYLTSLADCVCFSAAIPGQGGKGHINEQWIDFWINLFDKNDYQAIDCIRPLIWHDLQIFDWYKMNTILFVKNQSEIYFKIKDMDLETGKINSIVHPERYSALLERYNEGQNLINDLVNNSKVLKIIRNLLNYLRKKM